MFKDKKNYCIEYSIKEEKYLLLLRAYSVEDAEKRFKKKFEDAASGFYPYPYFTILSISRISKKIQI